MHSTSKLFNPLSDSSQWDKRIMGYPMTTFFHTAQWHRVLAESYRFTPVCIAAGIQDTREVLVPFMEIRDIRQRKKGVCLPFSDYCPPLVDTPESFWDVFFEIKTCGVQKQWHTITFRGCDCFPLAIPIASWCYGHEMDLVADVQHLFSRLRSSTKRNIRKAEKEGIRIHVGAKMREVQEFYTLNCITRKRHGLPPQPFSFFKKIHDRVLVEGNGIVVLAYYNKRCIGSAMYFHHDTKALYKYGASDYNFQNVRANNLVMWEAIKYYAQKGMKTLQFGKTEPGNIGLRQFKNGWRCREYIIKNYIYHCASNRFIKESSKVEGIHTRLFSRMPIAMLKLMGALLYKYSG